MEPLIYLDTHVVAWLFAGEAKRFSSRARGLIEDSALVVSPMVRLELQYLQEIGRIDASSAEVLGDLAHRIGLEICELPFDRVMTYAVEKSWTRDPFDRIIVAQAMARDSALVTKDDIIHQHYSRAVW